MFSEAFRSAWRPRSHSEHGKWSPSRVSIEPHAEHRWPVWYAPTFSTWIPTRLALYVMNCWSPRVRYDPSLKLAFNLVAYFDCRIEELFDPDTEPVEE
jgi:hypothetical protein